MRDASLYTLASQVLHYIQEQITHSIGQFKEFLRAKLRVFLK